jgi:SagB-type dehydrogenase family enzyme
VQPENNAWLKMAGIILFITATFKRNQLKYGERGYRGVLLDAGHLSQNILLTSRAMGYGACAVMACLDDPVNDFLGVDGVEESVLLAVAIGSPATEEKRNE